MSDESTEYENVNPTSASIKQLLLSYCTFQRLKVKKEGYAIVTKTIGKFIWHLSMKNNMYAYRINEKFLERFHAIIAIYKYTRRR